MDNLRLFDECLADRRVAAFLVVGPAGVGKTRLGDECLVRAARGGAPTARAVATRAAASMPLAALVHVFPQEDARDEPASARPSTTDDLPEAVGLYHWSREAIRRRAGGRRLVLFVDDLHLLDTVSLNVLAQHTASGEIFLVATLRSSEPVPELVDGLVSADRAVRVELDVLGRADVDQLLHLVLDGPVTATGSAALWAASQGNVLYLRELLLGAWEDGGLVADNGVWRLTRKLVPGGRLRDLLAARVGAVGDEGLGVLRRLALCEPVGLADLSKQVPTDLLDRLETLGVIEVREDGRRRPVTLAHPLYAQVIGSEMSRVRTDSVLRAEIARLRALGVRRRDDALRVAIWQLEVGEAADAGLLLRAARLSRDAHDFGQVERLARAAVEARGPGDLAAEAGGLLAEAVGHLGRIDEAEKIFARAETHASAPAVRLRIAVLRAVNLAWGLLRPTDALAVLGAARRALPEPERDEAAEVIALVLTLCYRPREAQAVLAGTRAGLDGVTGTVGVLARAVTLALLGRTADATAITGGAVVVTAPSTRRAA
ncbi:AAA family ATPase, partial [Frankia sp. CNm7]|uniref:AAA family ATPase n=1 Tax=Frankia nepalensis TaxID=1836974 RepID=UPI001931193B